VRLSVRTEELRSAASSLARASEHVARLSAGVAHQRTGVRAWAVDRGATQADAFLATLLEGIGAAAEELDDLALAASVAAQDYDDVESAALPRPR
jgi:hypothetical protein